MKMERQLAGTGLLSALAASLCCITPLLTLIVGTSSLAASFSWIEPLRPYLIGLTILALGFAWYQKLKPSQPIDCNCEPNNKKENFMQTKSFLALITLFAFVMLTFPNYAQVFYPEPKKPLVQNTAQEKGKSQTVEMKISGMTCAACTLHVANEVNKVAGILKLNVSYTDANALIDFDKSKTSVAAIQKAVKATGYKITETKVK